MSGERGMPNWGLHTVGSIGDTETYMSVKESYVARRVHVAVEDLEAQNPLTP
jgi:hypothetical protein